MSREIQVEIKRNLGDFMLDVTFHSTDNRIGILGESGCGKSMTLQCIAGIATPDEGKIVVNGRVLFDSSCKINVKPQQRKIGYLFQNYALFPTMSVEKNIAAGLSGTKAQNAERVKEMIMRFQLKGLEKRMPDELSGGQKQRVALARIMAYEPDIIMLDEPFSAMDAYLKDNLHVELLEMLKDYGGIVLMVTHSRDEIYRFCRSVIVLDNGKEIIMGKTKEVFKHPGKVAAAKLTGCKNIAKIKKRDQHCLEIEEWNSTIHIETPIPEWITHVGVRAHDLMPCMEQQTYNCISLKEYTVLEEPFETNVIIHYDNHRIWWKISKNDWQREMNGQIPPYLSIPPEKILFLKE